MQKATATPRDTQALLETSESLADLCEQQGNAAEVHRYKGLARQIREKQPIANFGPTGKDAPKGGH